MRRRSVRRVALLGVGALLGIVACRPSARPLQGEITSAVLPRVALSPRPALWKFTWSYKDETFESVGDGVLRIAPPDRARLDLFLRNGMGAGFAILLGDSLIVPGPDMVRGFLPPPTLLWAALGRLSLPPSRDTIARSARATSTTRTTIATVSGTA